MIRHLVVTRPFLNFVRGDVIANANTISEIMLTEYKLFVTRVAEPDTLKG